MRMLPIAGSLLESSSSTLTTVVAATVPEEEVASDNKSAALAKITFFRMMCIYPVEMTIVSCRAPRAIRFSKGCLQADDTTFRVRYCIHALHHSTSEGMLNPLASNNSRRVVFKSATGLGLLGYNLPTQVTTTLLITT